jgi:uncharacterized Zn finger protein (UPF0148 family)
MASTQKVCPKCKDQTDGRPTPHTVKDGKWKCGLCGHETSKKTYNTKKSKMLGDMINKFNEAKDSREYGYEGEMAMSQLKGIIMHAKQLHDMLEPDTDLPEWVQSKITLAYDYIQTAADYMSTELDEETKWVKNKHGSGYTSNDGKREIVKHPKGWISRSTTDRHDYSDVFPTQKEAKAGKYAWAMKNEEAPANSVGGGKIAGMGVGPQGEPGVSKKRNPILQPTGRRKSLTDFIRGN